MSFPGDRQPPRDATGLAPYACRDATSRGRVYEEAPPRGRTAYQRDRDRIIHSAAFRRLEYKTQVFVNHEGDLFRTRLTHTIEVAQVARSVARALSLNEDLVEAVALAHDLGHPPFGHAGQEALNACMGEFGGFEHNLQSLRIVDVLEERYAAFPGLNLTFETREGILKHCSRAEAGRLGELGERFLNGTQPALEAQLVNLADEIAYLCHDLDDGLRAGILDIETLEEVTLFGGLWSEVRRSYPALPERRTIHEVVRRMVGRLITDLIACSGGRLAACPPADAEAVRRKSEPLIAFSDGMAARLRELRGHLARHVYRHYRVRRMSAKAQRVIGELFGAFVAQPALLPPEYEARARELEATAGPRGRARSIADYIAGMTDRYAVQEYQRLFDPLERA